MKRRSGYVSGALLLCLACGWSAASTVIGLSVEDQARLSTFVVVGEVLQIQGVDDAELGIETAVTLRVGEVLKGKLAPGDRIVFHTRQGQVGSVISEAPGEAQLQVGQKALVFIESVDGRLYNLGLSMGVWNVHETDGAIVSFTRAVTDGLDIIGAEAVEFGPLDAREMASRVFAAERRPEFDSPQLRDAALGGR